MCDANSIDTHVSLVNDPYYFQDLAAMGPLYGAAAEVGADIATGGLYGICKSAIVGDVSGTALGLSDKFPGCAGKVGNVLGVASHVSSLIDGSLQSLQLMEDARK
jgi:hypothetical protein